MRAVSINPQTMQIQELDIHMQANTVYTFFNSILVDENATLNNHMIYSDANALSLKKKPYFIGEQIVVGDALIIGQEQLLESDVSIPLSDLEVLVSYDVPSFYLDVLDLLSQTDINLYRTFAVELEDEAVELNTEWVLYTFNIADERTKEYFIDELKKAIEMQKDIAQHISRMASLALKASKQ